MYLVAANWLYWIGRSHDSSDESRVYAAELRVGFFKLKMFGTIGDNGLYLRQFGVWPDLWRRIVPFGFKQEAA